MTTNAEQKALMRYQAVVSKVAWDRTLGLYNEAASELEKWAKDGPIPKLKTLTDIVRESDTENIHHLWTMMEIINSMSDMKSAYDYNFPSAASAPIFPNRTKYQIYSHNSFIF